MTAYGKKACKEMGQICFWFTSLIFVFIGLVMILCRKPYIKYIINNELPLKNNRTIGYSMWKQSPVPMDVEIYLFNWTNYAKFVDGKWPTDIKPNFTECGPYTYTEMHVREQVQFNDNNNTITYKTKRVWHFLPDKSVGSLDDRITTVDPVLLIIGSFVQHKPILIQERINSLIEEFKYNLFVTRTVKEWLFDGYEDKLLNFLHNVLNMSDFDYPFDKFGWFYSRNNSAEFDGSFTIYNGVDNINKLGRTTLWNGANHTKDYTDSCGMVKGTSGELWYPVKSDQTIQIFSSDLCSTITLQMDGSHQEFGLDAPKYVGKVDMFDNGTYYPNMKCFSNPGLPVPSGTRNVSACKFSAPIFIGYPHFYLADPIYRQMVDGMRPNRTEHEYMLSVEPTTGIPLMGRTALQVNLLLPQIGGIKLLKNVQATFMPVLWFRKSANLIMTYTYRYEIFVLFSPSLIYYIGFFFFGNGLLLITTSILVTVKAGWNDDNDTHVDEPSLSSLSAPLIPPDPIKKPLRSEDKCQGFQDFSTHMRIYFTSDMTPKKEV